MWRLVVAALLAPLALVMVSGHAWAESSVPVPTVSATGGADPSPSSLPEASSPGSPVPGGESSSSSGPDPSSSPSASAGDSVWTEASVNGQLVALLLIVVLVAIQAGSTLAGGR